MFNTLMTSNASIHTSVSWLSLVQLMVCHLFSTKPLPKPLLIDSNWILGKDFAELFIKIVAILFSLPCVIIQGNHLSKTNKSMKTITYQLLSVWSSPCKRRHFRWRPYLGGSRRAISPPPALLRLARHWAEKMETDGQESWHQRGLS